MKFLPHLHGFLLIQAFATQATSELDSVRLGQTVPLEVACTSCSARAPNATRKLGFRLSERSARAFGGS